jgi:hypothetical protein
MLLQACLDFGRGSYAIRTYGYFAVQRIGFLGEFGCKNVGQHCGRKRSLTLTVQLPVFNALATKIWQLRSAGLSGFYLPEQISRKNAASCDSFLQGIFVQPSRISNTYQPMSPSNLSEALATDN